MTWYKIQHSTRKSFDHCTAGLPFSKAHLHFPGPIASPNRVPRVVFLVFRPLGLISRLAVKLAILAYNPPGVNGLSVPRGVGSLLAAKFARERVAVVHHFLKILDHF